MTELGTNVLYYGDNLDILRKYIPEESVDLIYLDLKGTMEREKAELGLFITLEPATAPMRQEAVSAGFYHSQLW